MNYELGKTEIKFQYGYEEDLNQGPSKEPIMGKRHAACVLGHYVIELT